MDRVFRQRPPSVAAVGSPGSSSLRSSVAEITVLFALAIVPSWVAVLDPRVAWAAGAIVAIIIGVTWSGTRSRWIAVALVPVSALTASAIVPFDGRYIPVLLLTAALAVAMRRRVGAGLVLVRELPRSFVVTILVYLGWAAIVTLTSISIGEIEYLGGMVATLGAAFVATPILIASEVSLRRLFAVISVSAAVLLASGLLLAAMGGITVFGRSVGVYFVEELVLFGRPTGIVFPQNYGPFVGPATEFVAFAVATSTYLAATTGNRIRWAWWAIALFALVGLASSFSREGILMAALATGAVALGDVVRRHPAAGTLVMTGGLLVLLAGTMTGVIGVLGRLDLVRDWYGEDGVAALMNPVIGERGEVPLESGPPVQSPSGTPAGPPGSATPGSDGTVLPPPLPREIPDVIELKSAGSFAARVSLWKAAYLASLEAPIFGHGLGSNADAVVPYLQGEDARLRGASVHSTVMRMLVELGIPGLLTYLALIAVAIWLAARAVWRVPNVVILPLAGIVVASVAHQLFGTLLIGGLTYGSYVFAVALGLLARFVASPERLAVPKRRAGAGGVGA